MKSLHSKAAKQTRALVDSIHDALGNIAEHEDEYFIHRLLQSLLNATRDRLCMEVPFWSPRA